MSDDLSARAMALLLADSRLPSGAHVHSGGVEQAVDDGVIRDLQSLEGFLYGRLTTSGRLSAHIAARSCVLAARPEAIEIARWLEVDDEVSARIVAPALRTTSRRQGHALLRTGRTVLHAPALAVVAQSAPEGPHLAIVQGAVTYHGGLGPHDAALIASYGTVASAASAALRLLGLDPVSVTSLLAQLTTAVDQITSEAATAANDGVTSLPAPASPLSDYLGERHAARKERLFAS
jgi:urease accessory protein